MHVINNHETILTCLEIKNLDPKKTSQRRFQLDKIDNNQFFSNLEAQKDFIQSALAQVESLTPSDSSMVLDKSGKIIIRAIFSSLKLSMQKSNIS